jgi:hypothetical protein
MINAEIPFAPAVGSNVVSALLPFQTTLSDSGLRQQLEES